MPYIPSGATAAQLEAFARRLTQQLSPASSRKSLMTVREAFARGAGYPDAHALEAAARKDEFWSNPLVALGRRHFNLTQAQALIGVRAAKLAQWASVAWKRHKALLTQSNFTLDSTRQLLAHLWSHESWEQALEAAGDTHKTSPAGGSGLELAPSWDALISRPTSRRDNFAGIHRVLGKTQDNQWVGLNWSGALTHIRVLGEQRDQRYALASQWISQRVLSGDQLFLVDASEDGSVSQAALAAAAQLGQEPCVVDLTQGVYLSNLHQMSASGLATLILALVDYPPIHHGVLINWIAKVAIRWKAGHRFDEPTEPASLLEALGDPVNQMHWWNQDVGLSTTNEATSQCAQEIFGRLPADWTCRLNEVANLWTRCFVDASCGGNRLFGPLTIFRLPFLMVQDPAKARKLVALATLPWRDHLAQGLGTPLEASYKDIIETRRAPLSHIPLLCCHVDIPAQHYARGEAVVPAQSRALGISNLFVGPRSTWAKGERPEEVMALCANINTKLYLDPMEHDDLQAVRREPGQWVIVHANRALAVWPAHDNAPGFN